MKIFAHEKIIVADMRVQPGERVLEIGCGAGRVTKWMCQAVGNQGFVLGVDVQKSMIRQARRKLKDIDSSRYDLRCGEFLEVQLDAKKYDRIVLVTVLGEIPQTQKVLQKINLLLKTDGVLSICEVIPDPCYITFAKLSKVCLGGGLKLSSHRKRLLCYTANFIKK